MKYPRKFNSEIIPIEIPVLYDGFWVCSELNADGTTKKTGFANHKTEESCWVCCNAHNGRIRYSKKEVEKIIKKIKGVKKGKKTRKEKKSKKGKKV